MRVLYDFQIMAAQKYGGISRYIFELSSRMPQLGIDVKVSCLRSINYYFKDKIKMSAPITGRSIISRLRRKFWGVMNRLNALREMRGCDIIHPTYYETYILGHYSGKLVVTCHDMIHEKFNGDLKTIQCKKRILHAADHILAVSENTKKDLIDIYPDIEPDKITVTYHGSSMQEIKTVGANPIGRRYVLFVGNRGWYKNFLRFVKAMRPILESQPDLCVICAGGGGGSDS